MKILISSVGPFDWACEELADALISQLPGIRAVTESFRGKDDKRTLCVILACPCCEGLRLRGIPRPSEKVLWVTPFKGMDYRGNKITEIKIKPPFRDKDGKREAKDGKQFLDEWRKTLEEALSE